jgi:SepF-like predicted cell division protein (DUF552 family)
MLPKVIQRLFSKPTSPEERISAEIDAVFEQHKKLINKIDNLLPSYKDNSYKLFYDLMRRFLRKVYDIPASQAHHHSERFGLFAHSLETTINALAKQHRILELRFDRNGDLDSQFNLRNKERILFRTAVQGLLHDAGKIFDMDIISKTNEFAFDPLEHNLMDFCLSHGDYIISWHSGRTGKHEKRNIVVLFEILSDHDRKYISGVNFLRLIDEFFGYDPKETMREILKDADVQSVRSSFIECVEEDPKKEEANNLIEAFTSSISDMYNKGLLKANMIGGDMIVTDTTTLILNKSTVEKILAYMQKEFQLKTTRAFINNLMMERKMILVTKTGQTFIKVQLSYEDAPDKFYDLSYIIIKNKFIWGCNKPTDFTGTILYPEFTDSVDSIDVPTEQYEAPCEEDAKKENGTMAIEATASMTPKEELARYVEHVRPKKFQLFLKALKLKISSGHSEAIEHIKIAGQEYIIIGYPAGFTEIADYTALYESEAADSMKIIFGFINSLYDGGYIAKFKEFEDKPLITVQGKKQYDKAVLIFKDSLNEV